MPPLILASTSPYRKAQLAQLGLEFKALSPEVDEDQWKGQGLHPKQLSALLAKKKAEAIRQQVPEAIVIGADQVCCFGDQIFSKPGAFDQALEQLRSLQGQTHELITSVCVMTPQSSYHHTVIAKLTMHSFSDQELAAYLKRDEPYQCCGSYRLEATGISLFKKIECSDHTAIIGLPLLCLSETLRTLGHKAF